MSKGIVLLILDSSQILCGGFYALQLAKRETAPVYVLLDITEDGPEVTKMLAKIKSKAGKEGIELKIYLTNHKDLESSLLDLLKRKNVFQVLSIAKNETEAESIKGQFKRVEEKLYQDPDWPYSSLQLFIVSVPQDMESMEEISSYFTDFEEG
ncbi:hypothetical protein [Thermodesulfatator atlanticus]|uniref:hypothetical protein n=1 Tax=Thermodesulfatator atlanticus TaxID=501497 RepID=UPI0003B5417B|nr:hypothetical protein [Thermodesulfatator atlanticus]